GSLVFLGRPGPVRRERSGSPDIHGPGFPKQRRKKKEQGSLVFLGRPGPVRRERSGSPDIHGPGFPKQRRKKKEQ
ncbi:hypothetical protein NDU88_010085, partial [Pleurodeles waltl]